MAHRSQIPPLKKDLRNHFGYLSFNCTLINLDIVGIQLIKSGEIVVISFRGNRKTGFIYEGEKLTQEQVFKVYQDVPESYNDLGIYEEKYEGRIELLSPPKDNYVFISESEIKGK